MPVLYRWRKYPRLIREFFRACLVEEFEYRANFIGNILMTAFSVGMAILTVMLFFYRTDSIGGWQFYEVLALLGIFNAVQGFIAFFLQPNMSRLVTHIRQGTLDFILLKPVDSQFFISFRHLVFWRLVDVALGLGLTVYAVLHFAQPPSFMQWCAFLLVFAASLIVVYALWMCMMIFSFWTVKVDNLSFLFQSFLETARFPVSVYQGFMRIALTYVFPVALITTFPAQMLAGQLNVKNALAAIGVAAILLAVTRVFWKFALRYYTSASS